MPHSCQSYLMTLMHCEGVRYQPDSYIIKGRRKSIKKIYDYIQADKVSWTVIAAASKGWADKVFSDKPESERVDRLWDEIFRATPHLRRRSRSAWKNTMKNCANWRTI